MTHTFTIHGTVTDTFELDVEIEENDPQLAKEVGENKFIEELEENIPDGYTWRITDTEQTDSK